MRREASVSAGARERTLVAQDWGIAHGNQAGVRACLHVCVLSHFSCVQLCSTLWTVAHQAPLSRQDSPGKNTTVGCHALLQEIFLIQGLNPCLLCQLHWQVGSFPLAPPGNPGSNRAESKPTEWKHWMLQLGLVEKKSEELFFKTSKPNIQF